MAKNDSKRSDFVAYRFSDFDLESVLESENAFRVSREDCGDYLDEPVEVEYGNNFEEVTDEKRLSYIEAQLEQLEGTRDSASSVFEVPLSQRPFHPYDVEPQASSSSAFIGPRQPAPLKTKKMEGSTRSQRRKWNYTMKQREKRQEAAQTRDVDCSLKSDALRRAKDAEHVLVGELDVGDLPASEPGFIGLRELSEDQFQAISAFKVIRWKGKRTVVFVDKRDRIWTVLGAPPNDPAWKTHIIPGCTKAIERFHSNAGYTRADYKHRRADEDEGYAACGSGISLGGGQERPGNIAIRRKKTKLAMEELRKDPNIMRVVGHTGTLYKAFGHKLATESRDNIRALKKQFPDLIPFEYPSPDGPYWAAATVNSAPVASDAQVVTVRHTDLGNYARAWCAVTPFGNFDPDHGGHLVFWNVGIIIRFPPGCTVLFPSALVTHSNLRVRPGETRYSLVQYSAGALFRWVYNGGMTDDAFLSSATEDQLRQRAIDRHNRSKDALRKYTKLDELYSGDYKGEMLAGESELSELSDLEDDPRPSKRRKVENYSSELDDITESEAEEEEIN